MEKNNILDTKIEDLNLSKRATNCLKRANLRTIKDVLIYCAADANRLGRVRNLGKISAEEIERFIILFGKEIGADLYVGMPIEAIEHFGLSEEEIIEYDDKKATKKLEEEQRKLFLSTPLERLGISSRFYFSDFSYRVDTLGDMLYLLADRSLYNRIENLEFLKEEIKDLELPNIYFGMPKEEIENIYVSDEILSLLSLVIQSSIIRKNKRMDEGASIIKERIKENMSSILRATEEARKRSESIMADLEKSQKLADELDEIMQEQKELENQQRTLNSRIEKLLVKVNPKQRSFY